MKLTPVNNPGASRTAEVRTTYENAITKIGFLPNVTDDPAKVEASWSFEDESGRVASIWCYKESKCTCKCWSAWGDLDLLQDVFGKTNVC